MKRFNSVSVFIIIISILSLAAIIISIKTSITMAEKRDHAVRNTAEEEITTPPANAGIGAAGPGKLTEHPLYFNGDRIDGINAFFTDQKEIFLPIDKVFDEAGIEFQVFNSDDMLEAGIGSRKLLVRLWEDKFTLGNNEIKLPFGAITEGESILVPSDMFGYIDGFELDISKDTGDVFLNYYPYIDDKVLDSVKMVRIVGGRARLTDLTGKKSIWSNSENGAFDDMLVTSGDKSLSVIKSNERIYIAKSRYSDKLPYRVDAGFSAVPSADGRYLYWVDFDGKVSYVYDVKNDWKRKLGDFYFRIRDEYGEDCPQGMGNVLYEYAVGEKHRRITLTDDNLESFYTFIERNGKVVVSGFSSYSPNKKSILLRVKGRGYYTSNPEGTRINFIGNNIANVQWIDDNRLFFETEEGYFICDRNGKNIENTSYYWQRVGQTENGDVFFTKGNTLYIQTNGTEKELLELPWECGFVYGISSEGPYIAVSRDDDGVFCIKNKSIKEIGKYSALLKNKKAQDGNVDYKKSFSISPDNNKVVVFQQGDDFITINLVNTADETIKNIILNCSSDESNVKSISHKWVSDELLLVTTHNKGWLISFKNKINIFSWVEPRGSIILES
ncbi:MAG TPA: hypothetical protein GXX14_12185 [Clostridiaceae bacterium]|nr:hypothetical protein [Clostridiaceae bacterium]